MTSLTPSQPNSPAFSWILKKSTGSEQSASTQGNATRNLKKKIEEAQLETGLLRSKLDELSGKPLTATRTRGIKIHTVSKGENLITIANRYYQNSSRWMEIYNANKSAIGSNPNLLRVGMQLELP
ncbi:MAG: LysM peptidoglycan-binding domain-containing protein [Planctomyces sp.]|nr:LysM peptidoglycan-binding domain-containing protein [Planctomyces sp.]